MQARLGFDDLVRLGDRAFLRQLQGWLASLDEDPRSADVVADLRFEYVRTLRAQQRRQRELVARLHDSACGSLRRLEWLCEQMAPGSGEPAQRSLGALHAAYASVRPLLHAALSPGRELTRAEHRQLEHIVAGARADVARVHARVMWCGLAATGGPPPPHLLSAAPDDAHRPNHPHSPVE